MKMEGLRYNNFQGLARRVVGECDSGKVFYSCNQGVLRGCCSHNPCTDNICEDEDFVNDPLTTLTTQTSTIPTSTFTISAIRSTSTSYSLIISESFVPDSTVGVPNTAPTTPSTIPSTIPSTAPSTATPDPAQDGDSKSPSLNIGAIVGISVGALFALCAILLVVFFMLRRKHQRRDSPSPGDERIAAFPPPSPSPSHLAEKYFPDQNGRNIGQDTPLMGNDSKTLNSTISQPYVENDGVGTPRQAVFRNTLFVTNPDNSPISPAVAVAVSPAMLGITQSTRASTIGTSTDNLTPMISPQSTQFGSDVRRSGATGVSRMSGALTNHSSMAQQPSPPQQQQPPPQQPPPQQPHPQAELVGGQPGSGGTPFINVQEVDGTERPAEMDGTGWMEPPPQELEDNTVSSKQTARVGGNLIITDEERQAGYGHVSSWAHYQG